MQCSKKTQHAARWQEHWKFSVQSCQIFKKDTCIYFLNCNNLICASCFVSSDQISTVRGIIVSVFQSAVQLLSNHEPFKEIKSFGNFLFCSVELSYVAREHQLFASSRSANVMETWQTHLWETSGWSKGGRFRKSVELINNTTNAIQHWTLILKTFFSADMLVLLGLCYHLLTFRK